MLATRWTQFAGCSSEPSRLITYGEMGPAPIPATTLEVEMTLCIFLTSGKTFTFKNVHITQDNESVLVFVYTAMSDSKLKEGTFFKANMAGMSIKIGRAHV